MQLSLHASTQLIKCILSTIIHLSFGGGQHHIMLCHLNIKYICKCSDLYRYLQTDVRIIRFTSYMDFIIIIIVCPSKEIHLGPVFWTAWLRCLRVDAHWLLVRLVTLTVAAPNISVRVHAGPSATRCSQLLTSSCISFRSIFMQALLHVFDRLTIDLPNSPYRPIFDNR